MFSFFSRKKNIYYISANEVGEYTYCPHCWWNNLKVPIPVNREQLLDRGNKQHQDFYSHVHSARSKYNLGLFLIFIVILFFALIFIIKHILNI